jgi:hypothetical protein
MFIQVYIKISPESIINIDGPISCQEMDFLNKHLDLLLNDRLQLKYSNTRKKGVENPTAFFVQHRVSFRKYGVWSVESVVEWRIFKKGVGLAVNNFI